MRAETKEMLETFLTFQEYQLNEAKRYWESAVEKIKLNPNQMNPMGVWQREQLADLETLRVLIMERDRVCRELRSFIDKPKRRFQRPKKVKKSERKPLKQNMFGERMD